MAEETPGPGWYDDIDEEGVQRWWDGEAWTEQTRDALAREAAPAKDAKKATWGPGDFILYGVLITVLGAVLIGVSVNDPELDGLDVIGSVIASFGSIFLLIGIIAKGVSVGMRHAG